MSATRVQANRKQVSEPIIDDPKADDISMVRASFPGDSGSVDLMEVPGLTYEALRALMRTKPHASTGKLWSCEHSQTRHRLYIEQRVDRKLLLSLFEQSKQRLQVRIDTFGPVADQNKQLPADDPVLKKALAFMVPLGVAFGDDKVDVLGLRRLRNDQLALLISATPTAKAKAGGSKLRRPAGATGSASKQPKVEVAQGNEKSSGSRMPRPAAKDSANGGVQLRGIKFDMPPPSLSSQLSPMMAAFLGDTESKN